MLTASAPQSIEYYYSQQTTYAVCQGIYIVLAASQKGQRPLQVFNQPAQYDRYDQYHSHSHHTHSPQRQQPQKAKYAKEDEVCPFIYQRYLHLGYLFSRHQAQYENEQGPEYRSEPCPSFINYVVSKQSPHYSLRAYQLLISCSVQ